MKHPAGIVSAIEQRLTKTWSQTLADENQAGESDEATWPRRFSLSTASSSAIGENFAAVVDTVADWRAWAPKFNVELVSRNRRIGVVTHSIPSHLVVPTIDEAASICSGEWPSRLVRSRERLVELRQRFPDLAEPSRLLRGADSYNHVDFELLLQAGAWFSENTAEGLTPRQVPLAGFHAKWLNTSQHLVAILAGKSDLGLARNHPSRIHFSYLDPDHRAAGGRKHDSASVGDSFAPAYSPRIVIISENKDTAVNFPEVPGAISIEGDGTGGWTFASFGWLVEAPVLIYWGDMDKDGLEILAGFRAAGVPARSIFMDMDTFGRWERYGTNVDKRGVALKAEEPRSGLELTEAERALYLNLLDLSWSRVRRVEQERIPLAEARAMVVAVSANIVSAG